MNKADTPQRWYSGWRASPAAVEVDAADLGTAFGLDMSLNPLQHEPPPAPPLARQPGWMRRLGERRKNAA